MLVKLLYGGEVMPASGSHHEAPRGEVPEMKIITHQEVQENAMAVVYNACRREPQRSQTQAKRKRSVERWLRGYYSMGELFRGELKCQEEEMSFRCDIRLHR